MHSPRHRKFAKANSPEAIRRRRAQADARREAIVSCLPPVLAGPEPLSLWQSITVELYVPTSGRCDQFAVVLDGQRVGLLSATELGVHVRRAVMKRPSVAVRAECRRDDWATAVAALEN